MYSVHFVSDGTWHVSASSSETGFEPNFAIDGAVTSDGSNVFKSAVQDDPWIEIDLQRTLKLSSVTVGKMSYVVQNYVYLSCLP